MAMENGFVAPNSFLVFGAFKINQKFIQTYLQNEIIASNFL